VRGVAVNVLRGVMRFQAIAYAIYGLSYFFIPDVIIGDIFDWDTSSFWARSVGAVFIAVAWIEWSVVAKLEERRDLVWQFALIPTLLLAGAVWEKGADTYEGSDAYLAMVIVVTAFFTLLVGGAAWYAHREVPAKV
jgi:hypothetical protein